MRVTSHTIEVFDGAERVACHPRFTGVRGRYSTVTSHMPAGHRHRLADWSPQRFEQWAATIGPNTVAAIQAILASRKIVEQSYRSCLGVMSLAKKPGGMARLEDSLRPGAGGDAVAVLHADQEAMGRLATRRSAARGVAGRRRFRARLRLLRPGRGPGMIDVRNTRPAQGDAPVRHGRILREPRRRHRGGTALTGPEMVKMAVDWEYERRRNSKLHRLRRHAALAQPDADIADIKAMPGRSVDTELIARLAVGSYLVKHQDVILQGPTGAGKTYVACALGNKACQQYRTVLYLPAGELFDRITIAERTGERKRCLDALVKVELLIIDDWFLTTPSRQQVQQLHTLIDRRHKAASTIYCTQLPPGQWHDRMEEKILADAIIDRITTNAHATVLNCDDSMRKHFNQID